MKKLLFAALAAFLPLALAAASPKPTVLVVTPGIEAAPDEFRAAERLVRLETRGGSSTVRHLVLDESTYRKADKAMAAIQGAATDPAVTALLVSPAGEGTLSAFQALSASRPELIRIAISPVEDILPIEASSTIVVSTDVVGRAWALARAASLKGMAEIAFIDGSAPFGSSESARFKTILSARCDAEGIDFVVKDPSEDLSDFLRQQAAAHPGRVLIWNQDEKRRAETLSLARDLRLSSFEGPFPSLLLEYAGLAGLKPALEDDDPQKVLKKAEKAFIDAGVGGRFGTWIMPQGWILTMALGLEVLSGDISNEGPVRLEKLQQALNRSASGVKTALAFRTDPDSGIRSRNHLVFREDTYLLGKGFLSLVPGTVPKALYFTGK